MRVVHADEVRDSRRPPLVLARRGHAAGGRVVERPGKRPVRANDLAAGRIDRVVRPRMLRPDTTVDLAAGVVVEVEPGARPPADKAVRASNDRLGPESLRMPRCGHLPRDDALDVGLEPDVVDGGEPPAARSDAKQATVTVAGEPEHGRPRPEAHRAGEPAPLAARGPDPQRRAENVGPGIEIVGSPVHVLHREGRRGADGELAGAVCDQDAHPADACRAERRSPVEVVQDPLVVAPAVSREPVGAVLGKAETVPPALALDDEGRAGLRRRGGRECDNERDGCYENPTHADP
jgi:hypothetical protein